MITRTLILELNEDDEPETVEGFNAYVDALHEIVGQTMYNCREPNPDIARSHPQGLDKIRQAPKELATLMQEYVDERDNDEMGLKDPQVVELFNDFLLFLLFENGGVDPLVRVKSINPDDVVCHGGFVATLTK